MQSQGVKVQYKQYMVCFVLLICISMGYSLSSKTISTFNNSLSAENISMGTLGYCFQETATVLTSCGGLSTGGYGFSAGTGTPNTYDGDYTTYGTIAPVTAYMYINYTRPIYAGYGSLWQVRDDDTNYVQPKNISISRNCLNRPILQLRIQFWEDGVNPTITYQCYDGDWTTLEQRTGNTAYLFYDESIYWNLNKKVRYLSFTNGYFKNLTINLRGYSTDTINTTKYGKDIGGQLFIEKVAISNEGPPLDEERVYFDDIGLFNYTVKGQCKGGYACSNTSSDYTYFESAESGTIEDKWEGVGVGTMAVYSGLYNNFGTKSIQTNSSSLFIQSRTNYSRSTAMTAWINSSWAPLADIRRFLTVYANTTDALCSIGLRGNGNNLVAGLDGAIYPTSNGWAVEANKSFQVMIQMQGNNCTMYARNSSGEEFVFVQSYGLTYEEFPYYGSFSSTIMEYSTKWKDTSDRSIVINYTTANTISPRNATLATAMKVTMNLSQYANKVYIRAISGDNMLCYFYVNPSELNITIGNTTVEKNTAYSTPLKSRFQGMIQVNNSMCSFFARNNSLQTYEYLGSINTTKINNITKPEVSMSNNGEVFFSDITLFNWTAFGYDNSGYPQDISMEFGETNNGNEFNNTGLFTTQATANVSDTLINSIIQAGCNCYNCHSRAGYCDIPFLFESTSSGLLEYSLLNATYNYGLATCTAEINNIAINFSALEENNRTPMNITVNGVATYTIDNIDYSNFSFSYGDISNFSLCIYPSYANVHTEIYLQYYGAGAITERYYIENLNLTNTTNQVNLYNFVDSTGLSELTATIYNYYFSVYPNIIMKMQRYFPAINSWITVQVDKSDEFGKGLFYVYQNSVDYRFIWEENNTQLDRKSGGGSTEPLKFICDSATTCSQSFSIGQQTVDSNYAGFSYTTSYDNNTGIFILSWSDSNSLVSSVRLLVEQQRSNGVTTICDQTTASSSGSITCDISGYNGYISVRGYRAASPADPFFSTFIDKIVKGLKNVLGSKGRTNDGILMGFFIMATIGVIGSFSVATSVIIAALGFVLLFILGLWSFITIAGVIGGVCIAFIIAYLTGNR